MPTRLVPAVVVVLLVVAPLAGVPVGAAPEQPAASQPAATGLVPSAAVPDARAANDSQALPGTGLVLDAASADDGSYLVGTTALRAGNSSVTRLAPNGSVRWQWSAGTANDSRGAVKVAADAGGVYVLERTEAPVAPTPHSQPPKASLTRISADGTHEWTRELGNATLSTRAVDMLVTDGDLVLARPTESRPARTRLTRFTADGEVAWERTYGGGTPRALAADGEDLLLAGQHAFREAWLLRLDADGAVVTNETYGSFHGREVVGVVPTDDGGALLAGSAETRGFGGSDAWVARVDDDGAVRWSRTYGVEAREYPQTAEATDRGVLLVLRTDGEFGERGARLAHVTAEGGFGSHTLDTDRPVTTVLVDGDGVRLYGAEFDRRNRTADASVRGVELPSPTGGDLRSHAGLSSNETFRRGQNLRVEASGNATWGLYRLPSEYTDFDEPRLVRRLSPGADGSAVFETATLTSGRYAVRSAPNFWLELDDGRLTNLTSNASAAAVDLEDHDLWRAEPNRTVVETHEGERAVGVRIDSDPENFTARVGLTRLNGTGVAPDTMRAALAADPQFGGTEGVFTADGRSYGTVEMGPDANLTLDATALPAGLYRLSVTGTETADAADPATTRLVVVHEERPVELTPGNRSLAATPNGSAATNLTLSGLDGGVGAIRIEANRTGGPPIRLNLEFTDAVDYRSASGGAGLGPGRSSAEVQSLDVRSSPNGSFTVARLRVEPSDYRRPHDGPTSNRTNVTVGLAWAVDRNGVPYTVPGKSTVVFELLNASEVNSGSEPRRTGEGEASGSTSASGGGPG